jgi:hypothetical protein
MDEILITVEHHRRGGRGAPTVPREVLDFVAGGLVSAEEQQGARQNPDAPGQSRIWHCQNLRGQCATLCLWTNGRAWGLAALGPCLGPCPLPGGGAK